MTREASRQIADRLRTRATKPTPILCPFVRTTINVLVYSHVRTAYAYERQVNLLPYE